MHRCPTFCVIFSQTSRNPQCQSGKTSFDFYGPLYNPRFSGFPGANRAKTNLRSLFKASRELLQFMHWSETSRISDAKYLRPVSTSLDSPSHKHLYSTAPDAIADFKESLVPNKLRPVLTSMDPLSSMHQSATVSGALPDFQESLVPSKLFRNNELVISLLRVNYLIITS